MAPRMRPPRTGRNRRGFTLEHPPMSSTVSAAAPSSPHVMNTYGRLAMAVSHGQGCRVWDVNGRESGQTDGRFGDALGDGRDIF